MTGKSKNGRMEVTFWGVRGSLPTPDASTLKYGGNTSCVQVRCGETLMIIDCGSGLRPLGVELSNINSLTAHLFISHYHWDHICGIPFFAPMFNPQNTFHFYGEGRGKLRLKAILSGQMKYPYFPVGLDVFHSQIKYNTIQAGDAVDLGDVKVKTASLNHPQCAIAYRIEHQGKSVVYCSDNEHQDEMPRELKKLIRGCDMLIYDAAYTDDEYIGRSGKISKVGWGHSTWNEAIKTAKQLKVGQLYIYHHDPMHSDSVIDGLVRESRKSFKGVHAAREGLTVKI